MSDVSSASLKRHGLGWVLVLLGAFGFSAKAILIKLAYTASSEATAINLMALRMAFSLPFFLLAAVWKRSPGKAPIQRRQWLALAILGLMGYYLASYLDFWGLRFISAGLERVILFLYPTFVVLFSALWFQRPIGLRTAIALLLSYAGLFCVFAGQMSPGSSQVWLGSGLVLGSALVFYIFTLGSGLLTPRIGSAQFTAYTMIFACLATLLHFFIEQQIAVLLGLPLPIYVLAGIMAIFSTVLPAFLMNAGIQRIGADTASIISGIGPVMTLGLAFVFLHEPITGRQLLGTAGVLAGVYVLGINAKR